MDTKKLRQKILDLAIHGRLVPQDPADEPASVLLDRIRQEKQRLIKEGKIRPSKKSKAESSDKSRYPYELPKGWVWCRLGEVIDFINGRAYKKEELLSTGKYKVLRVGNFFTNNEWYYSDMELPNDKYCYNGDLLYAWSASFGPQIWNGEKTIFHYHIWNVQYDKRFFSREYLYYFFLYDKAHILSSTTGSTMIHVSMEHMKPRLIPLPPFAEQKRIVSEIERWFALIDDIERGKSELQAAIKRTKVKVLDLAIHGKLVPQDPADEPASVLLDRIRQEKQRLIKEGKIRLSKKAKAASSDKRPYPYELPKGWVWTTLGEISDYGECTTINVEQIGAKSWILELEDIEKDSGRIIKKIFRGNRNINGVRHEFHKDSVLYSKLRTYLNKVLVAPCTGFCTTEIIPFSTFEGIFPKYICHVLRSPYFLAYTAQCGYGVKMPRLSTIDARNGLVPLPPLAEQRRIVERIENIFSRLDAISESL